MQDEREVNLFSVQPKIGTIVTQPLHKNEQFSEDLKRSISTALSSTDTTDTSITGYIDLLQRT